MSGGGGGSVGRGGEPGVGYLAWATGVREDGVASVRAGGGRWLGVGDACRRSWIGTVGICKM